MPSPAHVPSLARTPDDLHAIIQDAINRADLDALSAALKPPLAIREHALGRLAQSDAESSQGCYEPLRNSAWSREEGSSSMSE
jgi:hypothetical protein